MSLLAEEIVEEWLNRQGFFTIRGIKLGVHEIDLLAIRVIDGEIERRHVEVTASIRPVSYISKVSKERQKLTGLNPMSAKERSLDELSEDVREWVKTKYQIARKDNLRQALCPGEWNLELVVRNVKHPEELKLISKHNITIHYLPEVVSDLESKGNIVSGAAGADLLELVSIGAEIDNEENN